MQITVFGASGKVGRLVVEESLRCGHSVTAFVHSHSILAANKKLTIYKGDVYTHADVAAALEGSQAVVSTLSSWGTQRKDVLSVGMRNIIPVMQSLKIDRIISLTGSEARAFGDHLGIIHRIMHRTLRLLAQEVLHDSEAHIALLEKSNLTWTVIRSPIMRTFGNKQNYKLTDRRPMPWSTINRHAVALALVDLLENSDGIAKSPFIAHP